MIKLSWSWFDRPLVFQALQKIARTDRLPAETSYRAGRIISAVNKQMEEARVSCAGILKKYAFMDPLTNLPKGWPNGPFEFLEADGEKKHDEEFLKIMETEFEIRVNKLPVHHLNECRLTPEEMHAIDEIIEDVSEKPRILTVN